MFLHGSDRVVRYRLYSPGGNNSLMVTIPALGEFIEINLHKDVRRVVTNNQCVPASWSKGVLPYGGIRVLAR